MFNDVDPDERAARVRRRKAYLAELDAQVAYQRSLSNDDAGSANVARERRLFELQRVDARTALAPLETRSFSHDSPRGGVASASSPFPVHGRRSPVSSGAHFGVQAHADARRRDSAARYKFELEKQIAAQKAAKEAAAREERRALEIEEARVEAERKALMRRFRRDEFVEEHATDSVSDENKDKAEDETFIVEESKFIEIVTKSPPREVQMIEPTVDAVPRREEVDVAVAPVVETALAFERGSVRSMASMWQKKLETSAANDRI